MTLQPPPFITRNELRHLSGALCTNATQGREERQWKLRQAQDVQFKSTVECGGLRSTCEDARGVCLALGVCVPGAGITKPLGSGMLVTGCKRSNASRSLLGIPPPVTPDGSFGLYCGAHRPAMPPLATTHGRGSRNGPRLASTGPRPSARSPQALRSAMATWCSISPVLGQARQFRNSSASVPPK